MKVFRIVIETFEPSNPFPIVTHTFQGRNAAQAEAFVRAHEASDRFFRECGTTGLFAGKVPCKQRRTFSGWVEL
jgi:hypothetical protein